VLLCTRAEIIRGTLAARLVKTDYASFVAWRDWGRPDLNAWSCFGVPAVFSSDGALLVGVMGAWTLNAGRAYPPSGSLEPRDVQADGSVDLLGSMVTELREETGLDLSHAKAGEMVAIFEGPRIAVTRRHDFPLPFADIERRFALHNATESSPELERIEAVWNASQIDSRMPPYAQEIIRYFHR
jgi:8-oxo-dGTP pyrophosphatase MutT (NUDIX family)